MLHLQLNPLILLFNTNDQHQLLLKNQLEISLITLLWNRNQLYLLIFKVSNLVDYLLPLLIFST